MIKPIILVKGTNVKTELELEVFKSLQKLCRFVGYRNKHDLKGKHRMKTLMFQTARSVRRPCRERGTRTTWCCLEMWNYAEVLYFQDIIINRIGKKHYLVSFSFQPLNQEVYLTKATKTSNPTI